MQEHTNESYQQSKISEYELLTKYNPKYINSKIKTAQSHIDEMYHLSTSITTCDDIMGVISVSYPVDNLVIWISETKDNLKRFKDDSAMRLYLLKQILNTYSQKEQQQVVRYMQSHGRIKSHELIERLQVDLYNINHDKPLTKASEPTYNGGVIMFVGDKETLKDFILNYHNNVDDDYKDVSVNDFFTLNDDVDEYSYQTINADEHIFMNDLDILVDRIADFREYNIFMLLCNGRIWRYISNTRNYPIQSPTVI